MKNVMQSIRSFFLNSGQERLRRQLLEQNDRVLADVGFSRELLEAGVEYWPWRISDPFDMVNQPKVQPSKAELDLAIAKLQSFSDRDLDDINLARGDIEHAVRYGRPEDRQNQAA